MKDHNAHLSYSCLAEHVSTVSQISINSYTVDCSSKLDVWKETPAVKLILHLHLVVLPMTKNLCIPLFIHMCPKVWAGYSENVWTLQVEYGYVNLNSLWCSEVECSVWLEIIQGKFCVFSSNLLQSKLSWFPCMWSVIVFTRMVFIKLFSAELYDNAKNSSSDPSWN